MEVNKTTYQSSGRSWSYHTILLPFLTDDDKGDDEGDGNSEAGFYSARRYDY